MQYCQQCRVSIKSVFPRCPLCGGDLSGTGDPSEDVFPVIPLVLRPIRRLIRFIAFGTFVAASVSVAVDIAANQGRGLGWSLFVIAGLASLWCAFGFAERRWWNIPKNIIFQLMVLSVLEIAWDYFTGFHKWSLNYVIPIMFSASIVALSVFAKIRKLRPGDYLLILFIINILSLCSLLLIVFHLVTVLYPVLICFTFSVISAARIILFEGKSLWEELARRMHV